jgi:hypothetical protein
MMIRVSHSDACVSHGMHVHTTSSDAQVFAVGDSRACEVVFNYLLQPGVDFVPWATRTQQAHKLGRS